MEVIQIYSNGIYHHKTVRFTSESVLIETHKKLRPGLLVGRERNQIHSKEKVYKQREKCKHSEAKKEMCIKVRMVTSIKIFK